MSVLVGCAYDSLMWGCVTGFGLAAAITVAAAGIRW
jgi:hypothetical protein